MKNILEIIGLAIAFISMYAGLVLLIALICLAVFSPLILIVWLITKGLGGF